MSQPKEDIEKTEHLQRARNHSLSRFMDDVDLQEDLDRVLHVKKLITRLKSGKPNYRLILNHLVVLFNSFEPAFVIFCLKSSIPQRDWFIANTFLIYMRRSLDIVNIDQELLDELKDL